MRARIRQYPVPKSSPPRPDPSVSNEIPQTTTGFNPVLALQPNNAPVDDQAVADPDNSAPSLPGLENRPQTVPTAVRHFGIRVTEDRSPEAGKGRAAIHATHEARTIRLDGQPMVRAGFGEYEAALWLARDVAGATPFRLFTLTRIAPGQFELIIE